MQQSVQMFKPDHSLKANVPSEDVVGNIEETKRCSNGDWRSEFECPVCLEMMGGGVQIHQCVSGHVMCATCRNRMQKDTCPTCRGEMTGRATVMERLAAALLK